MAVNEPTFDALNAGVAPGGLRSRGEIRLLILYLLKTDSEPVTRKLIGDVMQERSIANYFEAMDAISELLDNGNITIEKGDEGQDLLVLTERGRQAVSVVEEDLPKTVRETALQTALRFQTLDRNQRENDVQIEPTEDGYQVSFSMKDNDTMLMSLKMFAADRDEAEKLKRNFLEDPVRVYSDILASLLMK